MKLNPLAGLLSLLVLACTSGLMLAQEATTTTYTGTLSVFGNKLRLEVDMTKRGDNLTGALRSLDQGNVPLTTEKNVLTESELKFAVPKIGAQYAGTVFEDGKTVEGKFTQNGMKFELKLTKGKTGKAKAPDRIVLKEAWVGELNLGIMKPVMQFRIVTKNGNPALLFDSITEGVRGIEGTYTNDGSKMTFEVKAIKLKYEGELDDTGQMATGTWKQGGRELPLELKRQLTEYSSKNVWKNRPQRPKGPFPYDAQDVVFENKKAEVKLAGTLTIPKSDGKVPAVILISGSGPQDRDETLMEHKPFLVLADYLSRRGIAVLRYDDRGTNQSTGKFSTANTQDLATDAAAAIDFLKSNDRIDATKIGLAGHSEGGLIAPIVATDRDDVAFTVLMAGTGITGSEIITSQSEAMLRATDVPEDEIKLAVRLNRAAVEIALKNDDEESITSELKKAFDGIIDGLPDDEDKEETAKAIRAQIPLIAKQFSNDWMSYFLTYDPKPALRKLTCPTLFIIGSKDMQVLADLNLPAVTEAVKESGNTDFEAVEFEDLNHLFQKCETGALAEYASIEETINEAVLQKIADWISKRFVN